MKNDIVTVVTVTYNCEKTLEETMQSVFSQNYPHIEYIIVDGKSKDGTMQIVTKYKESLAKYISEPDKGIFDAMNKGIDLASGRWIIFMNAGDRFASSTTISDVFNNDIPDNTGFIFGGLLTHRGECRIKPFMYSKHKYASMGICHQSIFVRTDLAKEIKFDTTYRYAADYNMVRQIYNQGYGHVYVKFPICFFDTTGVTRNHRLEQIWECGKICNALFTFHFWRNYLRTLVNIILKK